MGKRSTGGTGERNARRQTKTQDTAAKTMANGQKQRQYDNYGYHRCHYQYDNNPPPEPDQESHPLLLSAESPRNGRVACHSWTTNLSTPTTSKTPSTRPPRYAMLARLCWLHLRLHSLLGDEWRLQVRRCHLPFVLHGALPLSGLHHVFSVVETS